MRGSRGENGCAGNMFVGAWGGRGCIGTNMPISGMGGISTWTDAAEFSLVGCEQPARLPAVDALRLRITRDCANGASQLRMKRDSRKYPMLSAERIASPIDFKNFDLSFKAVARIDQEKCIVQPWLCGVQRDRATV